MTQTYCRYAPSLGALEGTPEEVWGTIECQADYDEPCVFFGLYGLRDFYHLWRHKAKKYILWAGSDIWHFTNGYWLDEKGEIRVTPEGLAQWINTYCESWVENHVEAEALKAVGIEAKICPSFMGNVDEYSISFGPGNMVYTSVSGNNFELYGWDKIPELAALNPGIEFHLYGNTVSWETPQKNVIVHGRMPKEQMNTEIKGMQGALRLTEFDGFSEILAKSILWGQWPVSLIEYPYTLKVSELGEVLHKQEPNFKGRDYYLQTLNKYPWVK